MLKKFNLSVIVVAVLAIGLSLYSLNVNGNAKAEKDQCGYYDDYGHACGDCGDDDPVVQCSDGSWACTEMECDC